MSDNCVIWYVGVQRSAVGKCYYYGVTAHMVIIARKHSVVNLPDTDSFALTIQNDNSKGPHIPVLTLFSHLECDSGIRSSIRAGRDF